MDMEVHRSIQGISIGDEIDSISIPITLQRLVMEAGANRDFSFIHHDRDVARATGASDAYANTFFIAGMFERLLREWMGPAGQLNKIVNLRMNVFNVVGDTLIVAGNVSDIDVAAGKVTIALRCETEAGETVSAAATVTLPL